MEKIKYKTLYIIIAICSVCIIGLVVGLELMNDKTKQVSSNANNKTKQEITDQEVIEFTKTEIKKKLKYPETARFQKEEILGKQDNKIVVSMFCISEDNAHEEGRVRFVLGIKNNSGKLEMFNIATNEDTCHIDVAKEFEELVGKGKYDEVYDNLFTTNLKNSLSREEFKNFRLDLINCTVDAKAQADANNYLQYVIVTIKNNLSGKYWIQSIRNGMITSFTQV